MKKKILSLVIAIVLVFSFSIAFATEALPEETKTDELELTLSDDLDNLINPMLVDSLKQLNQNSNQETIDGNKVVAEEKLEFKDKTINGNLIIFSKNANIQDITVNGDVAIFGQNIKISNLSLVNGATVIAGQNVEINNLLTQENVYLAGEDITAEMVARDLYSACSDLKLKGETDILKVYNYSGNMSVDAGSYNVIEAGVDNLSIGSNVIVNEKLKYVSENKANIDSSAKVANEEFTQKEKPVEVEQVSTPKNTIVPIINKVISVIVKCLIICGIIFLFAEGFIAKTKQKEPVKYICFSALKGLGWAFLLPIIMIILILSMYGIGVAFVLLALYIIVFWASVPIVSIAIMNAVTIEKPANKKTAFGITLGISAIIAVLGRIPVIGGLVTLFIAFAGLGIVMGALKPNKVAKKDIEKNKDKIVEDNNQITVEKTEDIKEIKTENKPEDNK